MDFKQQLRLGVELQQKLVMTPQLQQAIKLLQLSRVELLESVQQELLENPALADDEGEPSSNQTGEFPKVDATGEMPKAELTGEMPKVELTGEMPAVGTSKDPEPDEPRGADEPETDWDQYVEYYSSQNYGGGGGVRAADDELPTVEQTLSKQQSLADHLEWQLGVTSLTDAERRLAEGIIGNLDARGYLSAQFFEELAAKVGLELDEAEAVLEVIQELDPIGVACRTLKECLLVQAKHFYPHEDVTHAIIEHHLEDLERRNVKGILRTLKIDQDDLRDALDIIGNLEPRPGRGFMTETTHYIIPDVYIVRIGDEYLVQLNEDGEPKLKISNFYAKQVSSVEGEAKEYIQKKIRSAEWFIKSIHQRQNTIRKVTESIVRFQRDFLDKGVAELRPLILRDVAEDIGMHESTISRVTTNKYVHTPQGTFELKYFFNSRISSSRGGPDLASESVKQRIKKLVDGENPDKPLSDQKLCALLAEEGTEIARRTVAKYREMLNIPPSSKRKRLL